VIWLASALDALRSSLPCCRLAVASSSRRQSDTRIASADTAPTGRLPSTGVHRRLPKTGWIVTQLVTHFNRDSAGCGEHRCVIYGALTTVMLCHAHRVSFSGTTAKESSPSVLPEVQARAYTPEIAHQLPVRGHYLRFLWISGPSQGNRARERGHAAAIAYGVGMGAAERAHGRGHLLPAVHRGC
jgi:hypothetical protein